MDRKFCREYVALSAGLLMLVMAVVMAFNWISCPSFAIDESAKKIIVIDAGHGGEDGGAVSVTGVAESHYNLLIATTLNDLLQLLGYDTHMLRTDDTDLHTEGKTIAQRKVSDLKQRVSAVNKLDNAILISIHQNFFTDSRYSGLQTFYHSNDSKQLAQDIQAAYKTHILPSTRRLAQHKSSIYLLENVNCPAVLVECGFLSNAEEEKRLNDTNYRIKLAAIIAQPLIKWLS